MKKIAMFALLLGLPFASLAQTTEFDTQYVELLELYDAGVFADDELERMYFEGVISYDELPEHIQQDVLEIDAFTNYEAKAVVMPKKQQAIVIRQSERTIKTLDGDNLRDEQRSYRDSQPARFRPHTVRNYGGMHGKKSPFMTTRQNVSEKTYITRRSYYYFDKRDEQAADLIRLRSRMQTYNPVMYSEEVN